MKNIQAEIKCPIEYETNIASFMEKIDAEPVCNFDDFVPFEPLEQLDFEVEKYLAMPIPQAPSYDPVFSEKPYRPGCQYESTIRQIAGEPELEKIQMAAHEQMELLKKDDKEIVSGANVAMVSSFLKPIDYTIELLVRTHPTLREYTNQVTCSEVDPEYCLYPAKKDRIDMKDEIMLKNSKKEMDMTLVSNLSKTVGGAFVNDLKVSNQDVPGNFGVRVIETMPSNIRDVFIDQRNNIELEYRCDYRESVVPDLLRDPDENDYLTDEESDEAAGFEVAMPGLGELLTQFEGEDEAINKHNEKQEQFVQDEVSRGFLPPVRHEILNNKQTAVQILDNNISMQRQQ